ncbi:DUF2523 domain-containing protein [Chitiniphilus purpureus]|uniref:DUF2523 domain-containing protein n=1 Tax=Chitiniphilus purpureus TaxID=2981137 RepID=A0ABY6DJ70_9NEIS|nr:DUF2523 domain-containing protein [Chitiniphilus sp. CD1]UXY14087.1 DUF2523 domain-containing protein [Chitiniphilus sp. CD1]
MPLPAVIGAAIWTALGAALPTLIGRILLALGLTAISYTGIDLLFQDGLQWVLSRFGAVDQQVWSILKFLGIEGFIKVHSAVFISIATLIMAERFIRMVSK